MSDEAPQGHGLPIGYYIGTLILVLGVIVTLSGLLGPVSDSERRVGFDIGIWWGLVMVVFGAAFLVGSHLLRRRR